MGLKDSMERKEAEGNDSGSSRHSTGRPERKNKADEGEGEFGEVPRPRRTLYASANVGMDLHERRISLD